MYSESGFQLVNFCAEAVQCSWVLGTNQGILNITQTSLGHRALVHGYRTELSNKLL